MKKEQGKLLHKEFEKLPNEKEGGILYQGERR